MEIQELLKDKIISDPIKKWSAELLSVFEGKSNHPFLTKGTAELGLLILHKHPDFKGEKNDWTVIEQAELNSKRYQQIFDAIPTDGWKTQDLQNLLVYFFGEEKAKCVAHAWDKIRFQMYQTGYSRRSFRAPENRNLYFPNQLSFLVDTLPQFYTHGNYPKYEKTFFDLSVSEQAKYDNYFGWSNLFRLWSAALDLGNAELFQQMEDIIFNKDEVGKVTRNLIKALLNSDDEKSWELVKKLLLAAQRQEGLRQTILEALDETSLGALKYMIKVIIDNKLTRFSSVVRSVDVWAGLGWEAERETTVKNFLEKAHEFLESPEKIPSAVKSANNTDVYMALWAQGVFDVEKTAKFLHELYDKGNAEKRSLALKFAIETGHSEFAMPVYYKALDDADMLVLAWTLRGINGLNVEKYQNNAEFPELFDKLHKIVEKCDTKEKTFDGKIFAWTKISFNRNEAFQAMIALIGESDERLQIVLQYFDGMSLNLREQLTRHILKDYATYYWDEKKVKEPLSDFQREYAFRVLADKGEFLVNSAFKALENVACSNDEMQILEGLLKRKGASFRGKIIGLVVKQKDEKVSVTTENLLTVGDAEQRLAGLDIALQLQKTRRLEAKVSDWAENFQTRKAISAKEEILLNQLIESPENRQDFSYENGYGLWDFGKAFSPVITPQTNPESYYEKLAAKNQYGFSKPFEKIKEDLENLGKIYLQNKDFEYEVDN